MLPITSCHHICGVFLAATMLSGCVPAFSDFQSARTVGRNHLGLTPAYSSVFERQERGNERSSMEQVQHNVGLRLDFGLSDRIDLQVGYARLMSTVESAEEDRPGFNVFGFGPKIAVVPGTLAALVPIGVVTGSGVEGQWGLQPTMLLTFSTAHVELTPSAKAIIPFDKEYDTMLAVNLGAGFGGSRGLVKVRPEVGFLTSPGSSGMYWAAGVGMSFSIKAD